jgi:D-3-phosphoglycerate dehydrogenase / 2-oxoglutarate reductase
MAVIADYDALIVRSRTKVTAEVNHAATRLRVIGRAGSGLDNVDADSAGRRGIAVVNSPTSVVVAVAEHANGMMIDSFDDLLARSDFVSVHTPLLPTTRGLMGRAEFAKMKPNARLVFCARGGVVDESALLEALENQAVAGAALDVFENEPPVASPLVHHPRVVATPHLGAMTEKAQARAALEVAEQVVTILQNA